MTIRARSARKSRPNALIGNADTLITVMRLIDALKFPHKDMTGNRHEYMLSELPDSGTAGFPAGAAG